MARFKLTDAECRAAGPGDHRDGAGLFLRVAPGGSRSWLYQWSQDAKRPKVGLGGYPAITLARARQEAERCRELLRQGIDPREERRTVRHAETFREATGILFEKKRGRLKDGGNAGRWMSVLDNHILPKIGDRTVNLLTLADLAGTIEPIWHRELGKKAIDRIGQIMTHAQARYPGEVLPGVADVKNSIRTLLPDVRRDSENHPMLPWEDAPKLWMALGDSVAHTAFRFYLLNVPRVSIVTQLVWDEIDWEGKIWDIPAARTKTDEDFAAPLSNQSMDILRIAKRRFRSDESPYVFPSDSAWKKGYVSENTWNQWMRDNNWKADDGRFAVAHGMRATFGTWCGDNQICDQKLSELCIQHKVMNANAAAYLRSQLIVQRRDIMQKWANHITSLAREKQKRILAQDQFQKELDMPVEPGGRTRREVEEWLRPDSDELIE